MIKNKNEETVQYIMLKNSMLTLCTHILREIDALYHIFHLKFENTLHMLVVLLYILEVIKAN